MAGEYSRELSAKVSAGHKRMIPLGFHQGSSPGTGLRRMLVDENRNPIRALKPGEYKRLQTDRVVLTLGSESELELVRRIYREYLLENKSAAQIARDLNAEGSRNEHGRRWHRGKITGILTNEKYVGNCVYNRISQRLKTRVVNPPEKWIRAENVCAPIIDKNTFLAVKKIFNEREIRYSDERYLDKLRWLLTKTGYLSRSMIDGTPGMPASSSYTDRFGGLENAYHLIGYEPDRKSPVNEANKAIHKLQRELFAEIVSGLGTTTALIEVDKKTRFITFYEGATAQVTVVPCRQRAGEPTWELWTNLRHCPDVTIAPRLDNFNGSIQDYYILPRMEKPQATLRLVSGVRSYLNDFRFENVDELFDGTLWRRIKSGLNSTHRPVGLREDHLRQIVQVRRVPDQPRDERGLFLKKP